MAAVAEMNNNNNNNTETAAVAVGNGNGAVSDSEVNKMNSEVKNLVDMFTKLNPLAKEFVPLRHRNNSDNNNGHVGNGGFEENFVDANKKSGGNRDLFNRRRRNGHSQGRRRMNGKSRAQREDSIKRTVYVSDVDHQVTEERLAAIFSRCGPVFDCRICGDPHSVLRFAFVEFEDEHGARAALSLGGTIMGFYPVKVLPSKTAILPVNPTFLPRSEDEREKCSRTVYCTNIDKKVTQAEVKNFFASTCGEVTRLRLLGDSVHSTRIAFVEFAVAESAILALNCSGLVLGNQPIRVSPSKTPVRDPVPRD